MRSYSSILLETRALVWRCKLDKDPIDRSLAIVHLFEEMVFFRSKDEKDDLHKAHKRLKGGTLIPRPQPWPIFIA